MTFHGIILTTKGVVIIYGVVGGGWFFRHKLKFSTTPLLSNSW
jgi:hypothetical protein